MAEQLKIVIDADVNSAVNGMKALQGGIVKLNKSTTDFVSTLRTSFDPAVFKSFKQGTLNVNQMKLALETLKENMRLTTDPVQLARYNLAIKDIEGNIKRASVAGVQLGNTTGKAFNSAFQSVRSLAQILPGIGIAGLIGAATSAIVSLGEAFTSTVSKASILRKATQEAIGQSAVEIFKINAAVAVIKDQTASLNAQKNAREFLNKETGIGIGLLSKEKIGSDETTEAIKRATTAIFQKALAEAFAAKSAQKQVELFEKQTKLNKLLASIPTTPIGIIIGANTIGAAATAAGVLNKQIKDIKDEIAAIETFGQEAFAKAFDFQKAVKPEKIKEVVKEIQAFLDSSSGLLEFKATLDLSFVDDLKKTRDQLFKNANIFGDNTKIIKGIVPGVSDDVAKRNKSFFDQFQQDIQASADLISGALTPAFTGMFDAIIAGENPLKAFFQSLIKGVNQLINRLIAAAIQAAILSALSGGTTTFLGAFKGILGFAGAAAPDGGFALGGQMAGRSFQDTLQVVVSGQISGQNILLSGQRAAGSNRR